TGDAVGHRLLRTGPVSAGSYRPGQPLQPVPCHRLAAVGAGVRPGRRDAGPVAAAAARRPAAGRALPGGGRGVGAAVVPATRPLAAGPAGAAPGIPGLGAVVAAGQLDLA